MLGLGNTLSGGIVPAATGGCNATALASNGYSIAFDGTNDRFTTEADDTAQNVTYSFWMKNDVSGDNKGIIGHGTGSVGHFMLQGDKPTVYWGTNWLCWFDEDDKTDDGNWHHWMLYVEVAAVQNCKLYIDGGEISVNSTRTSGSLSAYTTGISIGKNHNDYFEGKIDEFAIFTGDKTECAETYYNSGTPTDLSDESNLIAYWRMEENTGSTVADSSSNSNEGTISFGAAFDSDSP